MTTLLESMSKGCVLVPLWDRDAVNVISWVQENIDQSQLAEDGIEREPHTTILYGFLPEVDPAAVCDALAAYPDRLSFKLGKISRFEQETHDVLKIEIEGDSIRELNGYLMAAFEDVVQNDYPEYVPHMTLAYVRKGACADLDGNTHFEGEIFVFDQVVYSAPDSGGRHICFLGEKDE